MPFSKRVEKMCSEKNAFLNYKKNRVKILEDKEAHQIKEEPFHKKYLRLKAEEKERKRDAI